MKVLLVGNSYTYWNNLSHLLTEKFEHTEGVVDPDDPNHEASRKMTHRIRCVTMMIEGGKSLDDHAENFARVLPALDPDVVVLQDHSLLPSNWWPPEPEKCERARTALKEVYAPALREWAGKRRSSSDLSVKDNTNDPSAKDTLKPKKTIILFNTWARADSFFVDGEFRDKAALNGAPFESEAEHLEALENGYRGYWKILEEGILGSAGAAGSHSASGESGPSGDRSSNNFCNLLIAPVGRVYYQLRKKLRAKLMVGDTESPSPEPKPPLQPAIPISAIESEALFNEKDTIGHPSRLGTLVVATVLGRVILETVNCVNGRGAGGNSNDGSNNASPRGANTSPVCFALSRSHLSTLMPEFFIKQASASEENPLCDLPEFCMNYVNALDVLKIGRDVVEGISAADAGESENKKSASKL